MLKLNLVQKKPDGFSSSFRRLGFGYSRKVRHGRASPEHSVRVPWQHAARVHDVQLRARRTARHALTRASLRHALRLYRVPSSLRACG